MNGRNIVRFVTTPQSEQVEPVHGFVLAYIGLRRIHHPLDAGVGLPGRQGQEHERVFFYPKLFQPEDNMDDDRLYHIAISSMVLTTKLPKFDPDNPDPRWHDLTASFVNQEITTMDFVNAIYTGHSFTCWLSEPWRCKANWFHAQHVVVDLDTEDERSTLEAIEANPFTANNAAFAYTTPSHRPDRPRARVVFLLDEPIADQDEYARFCMYIASRFDGADKSAKAVTRFFYGSVNCEVGLYLNTLPVTYMRYLSPAPPPPQIVAPTGTPDKRLNGLVKRVQDARVGNRNGILNWAAWNAKDIVQTMGRTTVEEALTNAALATGLSQNEVSACLRSVFRGM